MGMCRRKKRERAHLRGVEEDPTAMPRTTGPRAGGTWSTRHLRARTFELHSEVAVLFWPGFRRGVRCAGRVVGGSA